MPNTASGYNSFANRLWRAWDDSVYLRCPEVASGPPFRAVVVAPGDDESTRRSVDGFVDFWDRRVLPVRQRAFTDRAVRNRESFPYGVPAGSAHTARLLWDLRHQPELLGPVWLASFVLQAQPARGAAPAWEAPPVRRALDEVLDASLDTLCATQVPLWHHAAIDPLPGARAAALQLRALGVAPIVPEDVVATAQMVLRLVLAEQVLVRLVVSNPAHPLRLLRTA